MTTLAGEPETEHGVEQYNDFYRANYAPMVRLAHLLTGSNALAEDIVQDAFVAVGRDVLGFDRPGGYLRTAVVNGCRVHHRRADMIRRRTPPPHRPEPVMPAPLVEFFDQVKSLPTRQRAAIVLRYYADLSDDEIGELLHCKPATVRSLLHRGLAQLREVIEP